MKKLIIVLINIIVFLNITTGQASNKKQYEAKLDGLCGKLDISIYSVDVIAYSLFIQDKKNVTIFKQEGNAIIPGYDWVKSNHVEFEEEVSLENDSIVPVRQYLELCSCTNGLSFKIPKDFTFVRLGCAEELSFKIFGIKSNSILKKPSGYFFLTK